MSWSSGDIFKIYFYASAFFELWQNFFVHVRCRLFHKTAVGNISLFFYQKPTVFLSLAEKSWKELATLFLPQTL
jgi:hypothetical protein